MGRAVKFDSVFINTKITRCAHSCRYCSISKKDFSELSFPRFAALVDRLIEWVKRNRGDAFGVYPVANNSDDVETGAIAGYMGLLRRAGRKADVMTTGGLRLRSQSELEEWLGEWRHHGIKCVHASYAGYGAVHDRWNGRHADFEWLTSIQSLAGRLGFELGQSLFLTKSTLPLIRGLIERLDTINAHIRYRRMFPFGYVGLATRYEDDRIDEKVRDDLPRILGSAAPDTAAWRSEREWITTVSHQLDPAAPADATLHIEVNEANIDLLEARSSWDEIMADVEARTAAVYNALPPISELCRAYGDTTNQRIYTSRHEMDRLWLSRHLAATGLRVDLSLTQLSIDQ